ncbi:NAD(P)H-dependent glycerol-3-phosphate dehydrogenase [Rhizosaccharibacter radicis]|uniref:Glycerol-3-phosphate dehydrogenase [NAD(P)+] n=1 Tax=Rhizosaccharibacter radicis TaxID=2782605 RepID=A0ABT1VXK3_9PROT|nr:NAD(P)H-dependent glycerol-3-phosphate dehydrogenase [Acetobacteraceae bacterium KSS12]
MSVADDASTGTAGDRPVAVVGAGAWGTALAIQAARAGFRVSLWARDPGDLLLADGSCRRLPGHRLPEAVTVTGRVPADAVLLLVAVPTQHLRPVLARVLPPKLPPASPLVACCKGFERTTLKLPAAIMADVAPDRPTAVLSGPNFAGEVAAGLPAAAVVAASEAALAARLAAMLSTSSFRLYDNADPVGVQCAGAAKNVVAIAAGAAIGAGLGENARAALVTRGLAEIARLAEALGGRADTVAGLSGMGDLLLTCTGAASRNYGFGLELGRGRRPDDILAERSTVAEGVATAPVLEQLGRQLGVSLPIAGTVAALIAGRLTLADARDQLLSRPLTQE